MTPFNDHPLRSVRIAAMVALASIASTASAQVAASAASAASAKPATESEPITLSAFEVTPDKDVGYQGGNTASGSRLNSSLKDTAAAVMVFTPEFLSDFGANGPTIDLPPIFAAKTADTYPLGADLVGITKNDVIRMRQQDACAKTAD